MAEQGFTLLSPDFQNGHPIPPRCTCEGSNRAPRLEWIHPPQGARSFALIMDDPDAPAGTFTHWVKFNLPVDMTELKDNAAIGVDGKNDFQHDGYGGPCPPPNHGKHRYFFRLYALDIESIDLPSGANRAAVEQAMDGHILEQAELMGTFERKSI